MHLFSNKELNLSEGASWANETSILLRANKCDPLVQAHQVLQWYECIDERAFPEIQELIPAADSLALVLCDNTEPTKDLIEYLRQLTCRDPVGFVTDLRSSDSKILEIPIYYGGPSGPDLPELAQMHGMTTDEVIAIHSAEIYTVAFTGFAPGFGYLLGLPSKLVTPRRKEPRTQVPEGSLAIGGGFTGIYPQTLPGGWNIIGRTDMKMWDLDNVHPALLSPGQKIRFKAI